MKKIISSIIAATMLATSVNAALISSEDYIAESELTTKAALQSNTPVISISEPQLCEDYTTLNKAAGRALANAYLASDLSKKDTYDIYSYTITASNLGKLMDGYLEGDIPATASLVQVSVWGNFGDLYTTEKYVDSVVKCSIDGLTMNSSASSIGEDVREYDGNDASGNPIKNVHQGWTGHNLAVSGTYPSLSDDEYNEGLSKKVDDNATVSYTCFLVLTEGATISTEDFMAKVTYETTEGTIDVNANCAGNKFVIGETGTTADAGEGVAVEAKGGKVWNNVVITNPSKGTDYKAKFTDNNGTADDASDDKSIEFPITGIKGDDELGGDATFAVILKTTKTLANIALEILFQNVPAAE